MILKVGLDVAIHVAKDLGSVYGEGLGGADIGLLEELVSEGFLGEWYDTACNVVTMTAGRKSGKGCYIYTGRKKSLNSQAENISKKFKIENKGRYVVL